MILLDVNNKKLHFNFIAGKSPSGRIGHSMCKVYESEKNTNCCIIILGGSNEQLCSMNVLLYN